MNSSWSGDRTPFPPALRDHILKRDRVCQVCHTRPATEADHRTPVAECRRLGIDPDTLANGQGLCHECHAQKTRREIDEGRERLRPRRIATHPADAPTPNHPRGATPHPLGPRR